MNCLSHVSGQRYLAGGLMHIELAQRCGHIPIFGFWGCVGQITFLNMWGIDPWPDAFFFPALFVFAKVKRWSQNP